MVLLVGTGVRGFVALDELQGPLLHGAGLQLLLAEEVLEVAKGQLLPIARVILEDAQHVLPLRQHLVEEHKLVVLQRARLGLISHL